MAEGAQADLTAASPSPDLFELLVEGARYGDLENVANALAQGASADSKDEQGRTALHMACANGHAEIMDALLAAGANTEARNEDGNTPLHWACLNGQVEAVRKLMDKGASAAVLNNVGRTPVDEAITREYQEVLDVINSYNTAGAIQVEVEVVQEGSGEEGSNSGTAQTTRMDDMDESCREDEEDGLEINMQTAASSSLDTAPTQEHATSAGHADLDTAEVLGALQSHAISSVGKDDMLADVPASVR